MANADFEVTLKCLSKPVLIPAAIHRTRNRTITAAKPSLITHSVQAAIAEPLTADYSRTSEHAGYRNIKPLEPQNQVSGTRYDHSRVTLLETLTPVFVAVTLARFSAAVVKVEHQNTECRN